MKSLKILFRRSLEMIIRISLFLLSYCIFFYIFGSNNLIITILSALVSFLICGGISLFMMSIHDFDGMSTTFGVFEGMIHFMYQDSMYSIIEDKNYIKVYRRVLFRHLKIGQFYNESSVQSSTELYKVKTILDWYITDHIAKELEKRTKRTIGDRLNKLDDID